MFLLVLFVLVFEGLFVVNPAVLKIQRFMEDMGRSHEELKVYAKKLERSNKELQDFASVASHDLQEPLRKVQAFSDRLRTRCSGAIDEHGRDCLDRIQNAAGRMQTLINDLLTYSRVSTKARPFVPTDFATITHEVVSDLEARIEQVNGRVEVGELPTVDADPLQVRQLMQNLIGNSLKYKKADVAAGRQGLEQAGGGRPGSTACRSRNRPSVRYWSKTTASALNRSIPSGSSRSSSACTAAPSMRGRASAWPSAARSSNGTAARSRRGAHRGKVRRSPSHYLSDNRRRQLPMDSNRQVDHDPDRR